MKTLHFAIMMIFLSSLILMYTPISYESNGSALFMKTNSTGKIYANFTFSVLDNRTWSMSPSIYPNMQSTVPVTSGDLNITASPSSIIANKNSTIVTYTITAKNNINGTYALFSFFCGESPLIIGLNESNVSPDTYSQFFNAAYHCPAMSDSTPKMNIVGYSNMISKTIDIDSNNTIRAQTVWPMGDIVSLVNSTTDTPHTSPAQTSPLEQFRSGIVASDITCKQGFELIFKNEDRSPACVTQDTVSILTERGWAESTTNKITQTSYTQNTKSYDPFGITALVIYRPILGCPIPLSNTTTVTCPQNDFYLKINSDSIAYLLSYNICDGDSCTKSDGLSIPLPINSLQPNYQTIPLPADLKWHDGDTTSIQLEISPTPDNKTGLQINYENSMIVPQ